MGDLDSAILTAWARIRPILQSDPDELAARLARRRSQLLLRPPRAWCLAVRATDRRLPFHPSSFSLHPLMMMNGDSRARKIFSRE
jgi:hypothetical protein